MQPKSILTLLLCFLGFATLLLIIAQPAEASASGLSSGSCTSLQVRSVSSDERYFNVWANEFDVICNTGASPKNPVVVKFGESISLHCTESTSGNVPPGVPDANGITIRGYADNDGFPAGGSGIIWSQTYTSCLTQQDFTRYCTNDGTVGGTFRWGTVRLYISAVDTTVPTTYNDNSDQASQGNNAAEYGAYRCDPHPDTFTDELGTTGAPATLYQGNDVLRTRFNVSKGAAYNTGNSAKIDVTCGAGSGVVSAAFAPSSTLTNFDKTLSEVNNTFPDQCSLVQKVTETRMSAISGWTAEPYYKWDQANACSGCSFPSALVIERTIAKRTVFYNGFQMSNLHDKVTPPVLNLTAFTIGADLQFFQVLNVQNARSELQSGVTGSCQKQTPSGANDGSPVALGTSDAGGDYAAQSATPSAPAGTWAFRCTLTNSPNVGFYNFTYTYASPFTANTAIGILWNVTPNATAGLYNVNVSMVLRIYDPITDAPALAFPTGAVRLTVSSFNHSTTEPSYYTKTVDRQAMTQLSPASAAWWYNFTTNQSGLSGAVAYVSFNLTGNPFLGSQGYHTNWTISQTPGNSNRMSIPTELTIPMVFMALCLGGIGVAFVSKDNPIPSLGGAVAQLMGLWLIWTSKSTSVEWSQSGIDFREAMIMTYLAAFIGLAARAFLIAQPYKGEYGQENES